MSLQLENVTKQFDHFKAVDDLSMNVSDRQMFGLLGANGAGKTTTFRMILGLLEPSHGYIKWNNRHITYEDVNRIGYLPEERGLYPKMKVQDQLIYLAKLKGIKKNDAKDKVKNWLERLEVPQYLNKKVEELSKGNQQKIQFIAAVMHEPQLIILDEPFSGLDPVNVELLKRAVKELKETGASIVFSSHRMDHVEELCEHLCIMHKGKPVTMGSLEDVKRDFGKKNLFIKTRTPLPDFSTMEGVTDISKDYRGTKLQVTADQVAEQIFMSIKDNGFLEKFVLEDPSLQEIFIDKVGGNDE